MNQDPPVNAFQGSVSPSLLPAEFGGKVSLEEPDADLLNDPTLTENYSELLKVKPHKPMEVEDESNSGSVVVTGGSSIKKMSENHRNDKYSQSSSNDENIDNNTNNHNNNNNDNNNNSNDNNSTSNYENSSNAGSEDVNNGNQEYDYSDSDFEENLEKRLQDMDTELPGERRSVSKKENPTGLGSMYDGLLMALSEDEDDLYLENDEEEENIEPEDGLFEEEELQPLPPPQELDPDKLYALYAFNGPDPSHCQLKQDEACTLLNDQDSYWWLVRRYSDTKIGFAPAEILETHPERLARLNCWKNENMSPRKNDSIGRPNGQTSKGKFETTDDDYSADDDGGDEEDEEEDDDEDDDDDKTAHENDPENNTHADGEGADSHRKLALKGYGKSNKSVSFNDVISYADRYIQDSDDESDYGTDEPTQYDEFSESKLGIDRNGRNNYGDFDDDMSEATSDASFNTASMTPLNIEKRRQPSPPQPPSSLSGPSDTTDVQSKRSSSDEGIVKEINENRNSFIETHDAKKENEEEPQDGLQKIFEAPILPFGRKNSHLEDSVSIGEFSPSSSEWTNDSPQHQYFADHNSLHAIPPSRAIQDLSKIVDTDEDSTATIKEGPDSPESEGNEGSPKQQQKNYDDKDQQHSTKETPASSSSSSEEIFMDAERVGSTTSVNSSSSASRQIFHSSSVVNTKTGKHHPIIGQLYDPIFHRMDDLLKQINEASK